MAAYEVPLTNTQQTLRVSLGGTLYALNVYWNAATLSWVVDISDANNNLVVGGIAVVTGVDLLGPYGYLNFGGKLIAQTDSNLYAPPTFANLGTTGHLYFVTS